MSLAQQGSHRYSLIDEEADVALWFGQDQGPNQSGQSSWAIALCLERQRTEDEDFQHTPHAHLCLGILLEPLQQDQRLREKRTCWMLSPLGNAYPNQRQVLLLARVAQVGSLRQTTCFCPVDGSRQVALGQFHLCLHGDPVSHQGGGIA